MTREQQLESALRFIIDDFDQTGCSTDLGTVRTEHINRAREVLGLELLEDAGEEDDDLDEDERDEEEDDYDGVEDPYKD